VLPGKIGTGQIEYFDLYVELLEKVQSKADMVTCIAQQRVVSTARVAIIHKTEVLV
jgi:hypothetical protein